MLPCVLTPLLQVQRGYAVLEELEDALKMSGGSRSALLQTLSSKFYTVREGGRAPLHA